MLIHPELEALRGDDAPQRLAQKALHDAMAAWCRRDAVDAALRDLVSLTQGRSLADCPALAALVEAGNPAAAALAASFTRDGADALALWPLAHMPQRHYHDGLISTLVLARSGNVTLSLVAVDGAELARRPSATSASFWPGEAWENVLAGSGEAELVDCRDAVEGSVTIDCRTLALAPGSVVARDAARQAMILRRVQGTLVSLRLQRRRTDAGPAREYELANGRMIHQAAGNPRDSRIELMMATLGRMGRRDAAPLVAEIAREPGSDALRWQALRECLALDTAEGFAALVAVSRDAADPLAAPAGALRAQLIETYPQLAGL